MASAATGVLCAWIMLVTDNVMESKMRTSPEEGLGEDPDGGAGKGVEGEGEGEG